MVQVVFGIVLSVLLIRGYCTDDSDVFSDMVKFIHNAGHSLESHTVETEDKYILTMHRIPGPPGSVPIFFQHGILGSSDSWIIIGNDSLAIILANLGYDIWLGNSRSSVYCKSHAIIKNTEAKFWNYSFHEIGTQDLPAMINYVTDHTGKKLIYMGFSMGTTTFFVMGSEKPEVTSNISLAFALAPVAFMDKLEIPKFKFIFNHPWISALLLGKKSIGSGKGLTIIPFKDKLAFRFSHCSKNHIKPSYRSQVLKRSFGTASVKTIKHLAQQRETGEFRQFDYGEKNPEVYNNTDPRAYNLSRIKTPMVLLVSKGDVFATRKNARKLSHYLPNIHKIKLINHEKFCHLDFMHGSLAGELVYEDIIDILKNFTNWKQKRTFQHKV